MRSICSSLERRTSLFGLPLLPQFLLAAAHVARLSWWSRALLAAVDEAALWRNYRNGGQRDGGYRCLPALLEMSPSDPKPHTENEASSF